MLWFFASTIDTSLPGAANAFRIIRAFVKGVQVPDYRFDFGLGNAGLLTMYCGLIDYLVFVRSTLP